MKIKEKGGAWHIAALAAFVLAVVLGMTVPRVFEKIEWIGGVYVDLLKLLVVPLLMAEVADGVFGAEKGAAKRLLKTVFIFVLMFVLSYLLTALLCAVLRPGAGADVLGEGFSGELKSLSLSGFFASVIPSNIISAMAQGNILSCILFAALCGFAASRVKAERAMKVVGEFKLIFRKMLGYIMYLTPVGVFCLMGGTVARYGAEVLGVSAKYILTAWLCSLAVLAIVMVLPVWLFAGVSPLKYIKNVAPIWLMTLSTCSSAATLPNTIRVCNEKFGVPERITSIVVPLGCTIHMCGGAVSFCLLGTFTMQAAGIAVSGGSFLYMLFIAVLMNMAAPGIPGGGIVLGASYLSIVGAPTGFIGVYSGIYRLLDMAYTTLNVTGDITANVLIARSEK